MHSRRRSWLPLALLLGGVAPARAVQAVQIDDAPEVRARRELSEMVRIPAGPFDMGLEDAHVQDALVDCLGELGPEGQEICIQWIQIAQTGATPRRVTLRSFDLDRREATVADYRACVAAGVCELRALVTGDARFSRAEWPIVNVTWFDAQAYCAWRGKRLPTEAEWEKAARGTDGRRWPWGSADRDDGANRGTTIGPPFVVRGSRFEIDFVPDDRDGFKELAPPGSFPWGRSAYGVLDMGGNVAEWVADWFEPHYPLGPAIDPTGPAVGGLRCERGGSYLEPRFLARTYARNGDMPDARAINRGFRCARDADSP